jgi:hypothetical protein
MADPAVPGPGAAFAPPPSLAEQALANLVNQFARPLDFVRELAQNAIDAGSPRIAVTVGWEPPAPRAREGVWHVRVQDWGEGMDESLIDTQLTRLFASTKENDLTKIGKFGIGFTSIFALRPDAVLLRTGRHGEAWELLFHPDRTFDKIRLSEPVHGTTITLYKTMAERRVDPLVQELRFVLAYWCEHSDTPITFTDLTRGEAPPTVLGDDPFEAFADPRSAPVEPINRPLTLEAPLEIRHTEPAIDVAIGYADAPRFGFYNGGLTLLNTQNAEVLGRHAEVLGHLAFKVKHDHLEHTLTRDNVLRDEHWERAMSAVLRAHDTLRDHLADRVEALVHEDAPLDAWHARLAAEASATGAEAWREGLAGRPLFRDQAGRPLTTDAIRAQEARVGRVLVTSGRPGLDSALDALGMQLVADSPGTRALLMATEEPPLFDFLRGRREVRAAEEVFVQPSLLEPDALTAAEHTLLRRAELFLRVAVGLRLRIPATNKVVRWVPGPDAFANRLRLEVGDFGGDLGRTDVLALNGPSDGRVFLRPSPAPRWLPAFLHWRCLLVNRQHPLFRAQVLAAAEDLDLGAFGLASALLSVEGIEGPAAFQRMFEHVAPLLLGRDP